MEGEDNCTVASLGIARNVFMLVILRYCLVSVSDDHSGASNAALHHTPLDLVSLASQIQQVIISTIGRLYNISMLRDRLISMSVLLLRISY